MSHEFLILVTFFHQISLKSFQDSSEKKLCQLTKHDKKALRNNLNKYLRIFQWIKVSVVWNVRIHSRALQKWVTVRITLRFLIENVSAFCALSRCLKTIQTTYIHATSFLHFFLFFRKRVYFGQTYGECRYIWENRLRYGFSSCGVSSDRRRTTHIKIQSF